MPPIPADKLTQAQIEGIAAYKKERGSEPGGPFIPLLRSPDLMARVAAVGTYVRYKSVFPPRLSEFVILVNAREWTLQYEWNAHHPIALKAGLKPEIAMALADGRRPDGMDADETLLYDFCLELFRTRSVSDTTYGRMVSKFGEQGVIDAVGIVGYYGMMGLVLNTARTPLRDGAPPPLPTFPR